MLNWLIELVTNVTFLATIIGALVAFMGVLVALRAERKKAKEERDFCVKHKVLESASESVIRFLDYYLTLPDRLLPQDGNIPDCVSEMSVALSRLHFYCGIETIKDAISMGKVLSNAYTNCLKTKMPAMFIAEEIKALDIEIAGFKEMDDNIQKQILALLPVDNTGAFVLSLRQNSADIYNKISGLYDKKSALIKKRYYATEVCRDEMRKHLKEVYGAVYKVLLMARKELSFPIDNKEYMYMINQTTEEALINMEKLYEEIRSEVDKKFGERVREG